MPLQNRVTPWGEIIAIPERGTIMGNRGGRFHRDDQTLGRRRWASHHWICCELHFNGRHHEPMGEGYTSLFFLDEVTALAAGHRPCFYCRRADAKRFFALLDPPMSVDAFDRALRGQRLASLKPHPEERAQRASKDRPQAPAERASRPASRAPQHEEISNLPSGAIVDIGGAAFAVRDSSLLRWSPAGYTHVIARTAAMQADILTPPLILAILARGYRPRWHPSARELMEI